MTKKPHLHFYSDCPFFAGCENMLANFLNDKSLKESYELDFTYRNTMAYNEALKKRIPDSVSRTGLPLVAAEDSYDPQKFKIRYQVLKYVFLVRNTFILWSHFRQKKIDILHINNGGYPGAYSCYSAVVAARLCGVKQIVYVVNNLAKDYSSPSRWLDFILDKYIAGRVNMFCTGSKVAGRKLASVLKIKLEKLKLFQNGVMVVPPKLAPDEVRRRLGVEQDRILIGTVGLFTTRKGHRILLEAVLKLKLENLVATLPKIVLMGKGPQKEDILEFIRKHGLQSDIIIIDDDDMNFSELNHNRGVFSLLRAMDIFVLPSISDEDFPNIILEAMSQRKPVIASRLAGIPEEVDDQKSGMLVEPHDVEGLANAMKALISDPVKANAMGIAGGEKFEKNFLPETAVCRYLELYNELLGY